MQAFKTLRGVAAAMLEDNIDTDQLCPKQHLTRLVKTGFGEALFSDRRFAADGTENPGFLLNREPWRNAAILIAGNNFGCGSSREHAVWALSQFGIHCVIAPSFGDIFFQNTVNSGMLAVRLPGDTVRRLALEAERVPGASWNVDLEAQVITPPSGNPVSFEIEATRRQRLLQGLDEIGMTQLHAAAIDQFAQQQRARAPWLWTPVQFPQETSTKGAS